MTRQIRIGKDIITRLRVKTNGEALPLEGRDISVEIFSSHGIRLAITEFSIIDTNLLTFTFYGKDQTRTDNYNIVVWENRGKKGQTVVDTFNEYVDLVPFTVMEGGQRSLEGLDTETVELTVDLDGSNRGYSAYECWLLDGHTGTMSDFLAWLQAKINGYNTITITGNGSIVLTQDGETLTLGVAQEIIEGAGKGATSVQSVNGVLPDEEGNVKLEDSSIYESLTTVGKGFYRVDYGSLDYAYAREYFEGRAPVPNYGGCSVLAYNNIIGRNYDWRRNDDAVFEIHTPAVQGHYATYGISGSVPSLTIDRVENRAYDDAYRVMPFYMQDGVNEEHLFAAILVVPLANGYATVPQVEKRDRVCSVMLVRYILDNYATVDEAVAGIRDYVEVFHPQTLIEMGYEPHFFLKDATKSVVLEFSGNTVVAVPSDKCTNFHVQGVEFNEDGSVWTNADVLDGHLPSDMGIELGGSGLERWNKLNAAEIDSIGAMRAAMDSILFSRAYTDEDIWYSEFVGGAITVDTPTDDEAFLERIERYRQKYLDPDDTDVWITKQSCVYLLNRDECRLTVREDSEEYCFGVSDYATNEDIDDLFPDGL